MTETLETPPATERDCPRCGSAAGPLQEYCLECGARLPPEAPQRPVPRTAWVWPVLLTALVALAAAAIMAAFQLTTDEERPTLTATAPVPSVPATTAEAVPTETLPTPPEPTVTAATTAPRPAPPPRNRVIGWPRGTRGWTIVLASVDASAGRAVAAAQARDAINAGLTDVGILRSDQFSSLHPGYYVVFTGVYDTQEQAGQGVREAENRGFPRPYAREIVP